MCRHFWFQTNDVLSAGGGMELVRLEKYWHFWTEQWAQRRATTGSLRFKIINMLPKNVEPKLFSKAVVPLAQTRPR